MANKRKNEILVFGRSRIQGYERFVPWTRTKSIIPSKGEEFVWLPREEAEKSEDWVQPIPCAVLRDRTGRYCILRRIRQVRADLRERMTLVVGGHVDKPPSHQSETSLFFDTLRRELDEEVGVQDLLKTDPVGIVIDSSSIFASRHIALVYEVVLQNNISLRAREEFAVHSKFSGRFFTAAELTQFHGMFDPWSLILFEDYIAPSSVKKPQQYALPLHLLT